MTYPSPVASPAEYWKVIGTTWTDVTGLLGDDDADNVLTLTITDGALGDADGIANGQISDPGGVAPSPAPALVPFADLDAKLQLKHHGGDVKARFTLGAASNGIAPLTEDVTLTIGSFSMTIPAGSFHAAKKRRFEFEGTITGVALAIAPSGDGRFTLKAELNGANLTGLGDPVPVTLTIGDDSGTAAVHVKKEDKDDKKEKDDKKKSH